MTKKNIKLYHQYADDVLTGKVVACKYIKLACERYKKWLEREDIEFREDKVDNVFRFISKIKHFEGEHCGQPFILQAWQQWIVANIFGFYWKSNGKRCCKNAYIEIARKNGKTSIASALALYAMIADGEQGAEIDLIANSKDQARIAFRDCQKFAETLDPKEKALKRYRDSIRFPHTNSFIQVLSSDSKRLDGFNSHMFIADEAHEYPSSKLFDVLKSSQLMRKNPLAVIITTAGFNVHSFCYGVRQTNIDILYGLKQDDTQFTAIYTLDDGDDWENPENWIKPNPNYCVTVQPESIPEQIQQAKNNPSLEAGIRTKNFNQWLSTTSVWIPNKTLVESSQKIDIGDMKDFQVNLGVDLAAVSDLTALSACWENDNKYYFKTWYFLPEAALEKGVNAELYKDWYRKGLLNLTQGNVTDYDYVTRIILKINELCYIDKISYDKWNATSWAINATALGLPLEPFAQGLWHFNQGTREFERMIKSNRIVIDDNEITRYCFSNCSLKYDYNNNCKPVKTNNDNKIDGVISMLQSFGAKIEVPEYNNDVFVM